jgi:hypothetical protein
LGYAGRFYGFGVLAAIAGAAALVGVPKMIAAFGSGALLGIGLLSLFAADSIAPQKGSVTLAAVLALFSGALGAAATADVRRADWTSHVVRSPLGLMATVFGVAGAGAWAALYRLQISDYTPETVRLVYGADHLIYLAVALGLGSLVLLRLVGGARRVMGGVLAGAGVQTLVFFGGLVKWVRYDGDTTQIGMYLGFGAGAGLLLAGCIAFAVDFRQRAEAPETAAAPTV